MVAGLIIVPLVSILTPKFTKDHTDKMFSCYEEHVVVSVKQALGD
jgi:SSS family solute:Na+ symporter